GNAGGVVGVTAGQGQVEAGALVVLRQQRHVGLEIDLTDVVVAAGRQRGHARVVAGDGQRGRLVPAFQAAMLEAGGEVHRTGPVLEQGAGQVGGEQGQLVLAAVPHHRLDPGQHLRGDGAGAAEDVQRHAARHRGAGGRIAQGQGDVEDVVAAVVGLFGLVVAEGDVDVPEQRTPADIPQALEAGAQVPGVDILVELARTALDRTAADQDQVAGGIQVEAERVV